MINVAILYDNITNIAEEKQKVLSFLNGHSLLIDKKNGRYITENVNIFWINVDKTNIYKMLTTTIFNKLYKVGTRELDIPIAIDVSNKRWEENIIKEVKEAYGKEILYVTVFINPCIKKMAVYNLDKTKNCYKDKVEALQAFKTFFVNKNKELKEQLKIIQGKIDANNNIINDYGFDDILNKEGV